LDDFLIENIMNGSHDSKDDSFGFADVSLNEVFDILLVAIVGSVIQFG
jgi:hypothetical protein